MSTYQMGVKETDERMLLVWRHFFFFYMFLFKKCRRRARRAFQYKLNREAQKERASERVTYTHIFNPFWSAHKPPTMSKCKWHYSKGVNNNNSNNDSNTNNNKHDDEQPSSRVAAARRNRKLWEAESENDSQQAAESLSLSKSSAHRGRLI